MPTKIFSQSSGGGAASSVAWGSITGTLSAQTDLQAALDLKAPLTSPTFATSITASYATASTISVFNASKALVSGLSYDVTNNIIDAGNAGNSTGPGFKVAGALLGTGNTNIRPAFYLANNGILQFYNNGSLFGAIDSGEIEFGNNAFAHGFYIDSVAATIDFGMLNNDGAFEFHVHAGTIRPLASDAAGNLQVGVASLAHGATDGFVYIPSCAGTPDGTPTAKTGYRAMVWDSTGFKLYVYDNSTWNAMN